MTAVHETLDPIQLQRRQFLGRTSMGIGATALYSLLAREQVARGATDNQSPLSGLPHFPPNVRRVIYLFQSGAPSQPDLFDYKPKLESLRGTELPESVRRGQRLTTMTASQSIFPIAPSIFRFAQHGEAGAWVSELMPYTARVVDQLCFIKSMHTEAINHDPAITFFQTGAELAGRPSMGAWISYGLGSDNDNLPAFVAMISQGTGSTGQPLYDRLWGSGFLPSKYQGVKFRSVGDPVLYLSNPPGFESETRRRMLDDLAQLNRMKFGEHGDPEIAARISQYELAFRMQSSVPELIDVSQEPEHTFELYGPHSRKPGTFAANCLLARRLVERGVRFVQLFHRGWDQHGKLPEQIRKQADDTDQASAGLILDLAQRSLLQDTLVVWGGEFGRTVYCQGRMTHDVYGRDHHPRCFTIWMAGGGIRPGITYGETDDFSYNITRDPVHVHDVQATILHSLGIDHTRLTYKYQGRRHRLTDVAGNLVKGIMA